MTIKCNQHPLIFYFFLSLFKQRTSNSILLFSISYLGIRYGIRVRFRLFFSILFHIERNDIALLLLLHFKIDSRIEIDLGSFASAFSHLILSIPVFGALFFPSRIYAVIVCYCTLQRLHKHFDCIDRFDDLREPSTVRLSFFYPPVGSMVKSFWLVFLV